MSGDRFETAVEDMHEMVRSTKALWQWRQPLERTALKERFDFRTARAKAFAIRLAERFDRSHSEKRGQRILADSGRRALAQIIPWPPTKGKLFASYANRFVVEPAEVPSFRERFLNGSLSEAECQMHVISPMALDRLVRRDYGGFIAIRESDLNEIENRFAESHFSSFDRGLPRTPTAPLL